MKWNFRQGGTTESPQNADIKEFSKHIFESIVREAVQNSLDNPKNDIDPVLVKFEFGDIHKGQIPGFIDLLTHYEATKEFWKNEKSYLPLFKAIDQQLSEFQETLPYLTVSDFNTTGMSLKPKEGENIRFSNYYAFTRGNNTVKNSSTSAGSEGRGKAVFYAASALRLAFVHTVSSEGSIYEGLTRLATHSIDNNDFSFNGHLLQEIDEPKYQQSPVFEGVFKRNADDGNGSSITTVGLWSYENVIEKMIKSSINNFWMAILEGDLIIKIADTEISADNINQLIEDYLPERDESSWTKSNPTEYGKAKCYFETWSESLDDTEVYNEDLPILGSCTLKIAQHVDYPGKISFFRKQKMLIVRSRVNLFINKGYCGVFICKGDMGNEILKKMEGKTHTEWDPNLCMTTEDSDKGKQAIERMNKFIVESWKDYRSKHFPDTINLKGLAGLSIGTKGKGSPNPTPKSPTQKPEPLEPRQKPDFVKLGVSKQSFKSIKENNDWKYILWLKSNDQKEVNIQMIPATDAIRVSKDEMLQIVSGSDDWRIDNNSLNGTLNTGQNKIEFTLNSIERVALDIKIHSNEN